MVMDANPAWPGWLQKEEKRLTSSLPVHVCNLTKSVLLTSISWMEQILEAEISPQGSSIREGFICEWGVGLYSS